MLSGGNHNVDRIYCDSFHLIDGGKPEIEGVNHNIDGAKSQLFEYFVV